MSLLLETAELQAFVRIVEAKSFTAASRALGVPRQTLGRRIDRLEERLDARLLRRTTRAIALTDAGEALYQHAREAVHAVQVAAEAVRLRTGPARGLLRVSLPLIFDQVFLDRVSDFAKAHPEISLQVTFTSRHSDLVRDADVALRASVSLEPGLKARTLRRFEMVAVAAPKYISKQGLPRGHDELLRHDCLVFAAEGEASEASWPLRSGGSARVRGVLSSNSPQLLRVAARNGRGIALVPSLLVESDLRKGALVQVLPDQIGRSAKLAAVYANQGRPSLAARAFVAALVEWAQGGVQQS